MKCQHPYNNKLLQGQATGSIGDHSTTYATPPVIKSSIEALPPMTDSINNFTDDSRPTISISCSMDELFLVDLPFF